MQQKDNQFEWNQFCRLGEMIGDGLHREPDGKWISKEYKRLSRILLPDIKKREAEQRKERNKSIDEAIAKRIETDRCSCGSKMIQSRSGSYVVSCIDADCGKRYKYSKKKKK